MRPRLNNEDILDNENLKRIRAYLMQTLDSTDDNGQPDLEKIMYNATYNMGEGAIQIGGLLLQEQIKLDELEQQERELRKKIYEETMTTRMAFTPTNEGVKTMVNGDATLSALTSKIARQKYYIEFLRAAQENVRYYPRNAKALIEVATFGKEIGKII